MGGEIFDGKEVVEYFLKIIAKAMHCPATILGIGLGSGTVEPSENYTLWKNNLLSAIRNQLFMRHLWSLHGKQKGKQGGVGKDDTFVPFPRIKVEELLTLKERTDLFKELMNFANPLDPVIKFKTQIEFCKIMGWNDVIQQLPTLEEYTKELEDAKKAQEKLVADKAKQDKISADATAKAAKEGNPLDQPMQGQPKAPTEEQLAKRQEAGVNVRKADSKKGKIPSKMTVQETEIQDFQVEGTDGSFEDKPQKLEITVKTETQPQKILVESKSTPQEIIVKNEPQKLTISHEPIVIKSPVDDIFKILAEENTEAIKTKVSKEIEKINEDIKATQSNSEEIKKTQEKKREVIDKIGKEIQ
jgi:hypothetical protein